MEMKIHNLESEQLELLPRKFILFPGRTGEPEKGSDDPYTPKGGFLSRAHFLNFLRMEKRRSDRTKSPLSLVLFSLNGDNRSDEKNLRGFFSFVHRSTRETDIKGIISENLFGLILTDTDRAGAQSCIRKIIQSGGRFPYSVISATYPDAIFGKLLNEAEDQPDLFPINLDDDIKCLGAQMILKRALDVLGALAGLIFFSPLFVIIPLAVKLDSAGPVIFRQKRLGRGGQKFEFLKFRSMQANSDDRIHREYVSNLIGGNLKNINQGDEKRPIFKMKNDPRVTRVGKIIRKLSMDEIPQFWNVLRGEMSLVGPRPPISYEIENYEPWHLRRILEMKPGITGLWQVEGRNTISFDEMVRLDLRYVRRWSFWLDIKILLKTIKEMVFPSGAG
jgi:lipopolysaccharide/colanic/teichoic acid biosynthesis glycosyltransferase